MRTALVGGTVIDGTGKAPQANAAVVVEDGKIVEVGQASRLDAGVRVVDVTGKTVMPGIIDTHTHFAAWGSNLIGRHDSSLMLLAAETVHALRTVLEAGVTTARDLGGLDPGFRDAVARGLIPGPRLHTSIIVVSPINGILDFTTAQGMPTPMLPGHPRQECSGPYECRAKVREVLRAGADVIKIATSGGVSSRRLQPRQPIFTREEVEAIVDEAHMANVQVTCHATGGPGLLMAVKAGVDTIEHGPYLDEESVEEMAARGTWYVPTFAIYRWHSTKGPAYKQVRARALRDQHLRSFEQARKAGVRITMGTDAGAYEPGDNMLELELLVEAGMTPMEAIEASTRVAAECVRMEPEIGTLEPGKEADLLVVDGDPLRDIRILQERQRLTLVMQAGKAVGGGMRLA